MDRALGEIISEKRERDSFRGGRRERRPPRDGIRKSQRDEPRNLDRDWVHDRYDDDHDREERGAHRGGYRYAPRAPRSPEADLTQAGVKLRVDNLHYDLTEDDVRDLFERQGPIISAQLLYDRQDRSRGTAFVVMESDRDADRAIREFDGANAHGQPIRITRMAGAQAGRSRNPFDNVERPGRSLFERVESNRRSASPGKDYDYDSRARRGRGRGGRSSDVRGPTPENIDRYVPGQDRRRSPMRRNRDGARGGAQRGPGQRRERERSERRDKEGHVIVGGRPKKTQEELDAEMEDYWGKIGGSGGGEEAQTTKSNGNTTAPAAPPAATVGNDDIDMIE